ncbi:MAG TPA: hypothetical protein PLX30_06435 [Methanothrix sp.]|nr:hypothetical protein [Methanothrix sp.]
MEITYMSRKHWFIEDQPQSPTEFTVTRYLGEGNASDEWRKFEKRSVEVFLHTKSYDAFCKNECLCMFGHRGSGKTAILKMLEYEIKNNKIKDYAFARVIDQEEAYNDLITSITLTPLQNLPDSTFINNIKEKWIWILTVSAMDAVTKAVNASVVPSADLNLIKDYLKSQDSLYVGEDVRPIRRLSKIISDELENVNVWQLKGASVFARILDKLFTPSYANAETALFNILKKYNKKCLVMVDSLDAYDVRNNIVKLVSVALMEAARDFHKREFEKHIDIKVVFPSEVASYLLDSSPNSEKIVPHIIYIYWSYGDLVAIIAKRYYKLINKNKNIPVDLDTSKAAREFLYQHFPEKVLCTYNNIEFDTLSYVILHTHKKPRQIIYLFNAILSCAYDENKNWYNIKEQCITSAIFMYVDALVTNTYRVYNRIYPNTRKIVERALSGQPQIFDFSDVDPMIKKTKSVRGNLNSDEVKQLLIDCGALGFEAKRYDLQKEKTIIEGKFQYQMTDSLPYENFCVIHPMYYHRLNIIKDRNILVYPRPSDKEEDESLCNISIRKTHM